MQDAVVFGAHLRCIVNTPVQDALQVYCTGELLTLVQDAILFSVPTPDVLYWGIVYSSAGCYTFFGAHFRCIVYSSAGRNTIFCAHPSCIVLCVYFSAGCYTFYSAHLGGWRLFTPVQDAIYTVCVFLKILILTFRGEAKRSDTAYMLNIQYTIHTHFCGIAPCRDL